MRKPRPLVIYYLGNVIELSPPDRKETEKAINHLNKWLTYFKVKEIRNKYKK